MIQARKITAGLLTGEQSGALAQMKFIAHANDVFNTRAQTIGDEAVSYTHLDVYKRQRAIKDTAPPGNYNFKKAFIHSSNSYFITNGLRAGVETVSYTHLLNFSLRSPRLRTFALK